MGSAVLLIHPKGKLAGFIGSRPYPVSVVIGQTTAEQVTTTVLAKAGLQHGRLEWLQPLRAGGVPFTTVMLEDVLAQLGREGGPQPGILDDYEPAKPGIPAKVHLTADLVCCLQQDQLPPPAAAMAPAVGLSSHNSAALGTSQRHTVVFKRGRNQAKAVVVGMELAGWGACLGHFRSDTPLAVIAKAIQVSSNHIVQMSL